MVQREFWSSSLEIASLILFFKFKKLMMEKYSWYRLLINFISIIDDRFYEYFWELCEKKNNYKRHNTEQFAEYCVVFFGKILFEQILRLSVGRIN